ncbi:FMN-dependent NADH-azoreductase [Kribbella solani]|uniref:FMN dependent NADH:quinone oxidoreductase n=2 Tax=Kribbella solani TaxID=236067 RepID=A0A841DQ44_9ACTN|nr:NAD(P)H-dependent oxidoreductase [Kribbella solani]MBB5978810.1 FMN-dependent NADH-azoreductase [Kribbella solani]MDX2971816.1 NAD(P)H-dependent oxidoreductase [Kribbella solani]MDX3000470.1 NAD(P)H-dependent oxidoreductase [Kribbella solani]
MSTLLRVDASIRLDGSVSRALADSAEAAWKAEHPDGVVVRRDLGQHPLPATLWPTLAAAQVGQEPVADSDRMPLADAQAIAAGLATEIRNADAVLLAVPLYNYGIAQHVKTWIDVLLMDKDFAFGTRPLTGRPAIFALARGGGYGPGSPKHGWDHATPYLERVFADLFGMNIRTAAAELTLAPITPGMEELIDAAKVSESAAHVEAETHGTVVARELHEHAA